MAKFGYDSPEGPIEVEAESQEAADQMLIAKIIPDMEAQKRKVSPRPVGPPYRKNIPSEPAPNPAEGMGMAEKAVAGYGGGTRNMYLGAKNLIGQGTPEERTEREEWAKSKQNLGVPGMIGEGASELVNTIPLGMGVGTAGKVLTKAVPALAKAGRFGGRVANAGNLARGVTEGAISQGIVGDASDDGLTDRLDDMAVGAASGGAFPALAMAAKLPLSAAKAGWNALSPTKGASATRAYKAFQNELGDEGLENATRAIRDAGKTVLPRTTAAMTGDAGLAALESGAAKRRFADFNSHYENVDRTAWKNLARTPARDRTEAGQMLQDTFDRGGIIQTPKIVGKGGPFEVPGLESHPLRQALGKLQNGMSEAEVKKAKNLASELSVYEAAKTGGGRTVPDMGHGQDILSTGLGILSIGAGSPTLWKIRSVMNGITGGSKDKSLKIIDEALLDPNKFMDLVTKMQAKVDAGHPLTFGEEALRETMLGASRQAAVKSPQENQDAAR